VHPTNCTSKQPLSLTHPQSKGSNCCKHQLSPTHPRSNGSAPPDQTSAPNPTSPHPRALFSPTRVRRAPPPTCRPLLSPDAFGVPPSPSNPLASRSQIASLPLPPHGGGAGVPLSPPTVRARIRPRTAPLSSSLLSPSVLCLPRTSIPHRVAPPFHGGLRSRPDLHGTRGGGDKAR
jgi:hypothetical protein